jgi:hypothetical protein
MNGNTFSNTTTSAEETDLEGGGGFLGGGGLHQINGGTVDDLFSLANTS